MEYEIHLVQVEPQTTAVLRLHAGLSELPRVIPAACGETWNFVRASGFLHGGRHIAIYFDGDKDGGWDIECGTEVDQPFTGNGRVVCSALPAGRAAMATWVGPYNRLGEVHDAVRKWCADHGHDRAGPAWEVYDHPTADCSTPRTDVYYLLRAAKS
jgi:effector-binding domain-containing protein